MEMALKIDLLKAALVYDFDGTLAPGNMQEHSFIPGLGLDVPTFWGEVKTHARAHDADEVLVYMWRMLQHARDRHMPITRDALKEHGRQTPLFPGVSTWFDRIDAYALEQGLELEHYVISSGIYEMIAGCEVFDKFKQVFASRFLYDEAGCATWPAVAINYTTKTQFLFRINKGVDNSWDNESVNRWRPVDARPVPFERLVFIGDGETDIPAMKMVRYQGGEAVAVFDANKWNDKQKVIYRLIAEDRAQFVASADYSEGSQLDVTVKGILGRIAQAAKATGRRPGGGR